MSIPAEKLARKKRQFYAELMEDRRFAALKGNTWDLAELIVKHRSGEQLSQEDYIKLVKSEPAMKILEGMRSAEPAE